MKDSFVIRAFDSGSRKTSGTYKHHLCGTPQNKTNQGAHA